MNTIMNTIINYLSNINILLVIPLIFTAIELMQVHRARIAEMLYNIFNDIHSQKNLTNIEWLYTVDLTKYRTLTDEQKRRIDDTIDVFTRISFLCEKRLIPRKYFVQMYSGLIIHVWNKAQQYIYDKRIATGVTNYACYFEKIHKVALRYRMRHHYDVNIH